MKKKAIIIIGILLSIILLDSIQALVFDNNPIIGIQTRGMKKEGILVDTYHCGNGKHDTVIKGFSYTCSYNGGNYILVDNAKYCATMKSEFYQDENYIYYWDCTKNQDMIVKYDNGFEETIDEALKQGHIVIQDLDKFEINYIKEEKVNDEKQFQFIGTIIEVHDNSIIVEPAEGTKERKSSDKIIVKRITNDVYDVGNKVKITYNGFINESYPAQISAIEIELVR